MSAERHDDAAAYALNALDDDERIEFERHLSGCTDCRREVAEFRAVTDGLASVLEQAPPPHLRDAVLSRLSGIVQEPGPRAGAGAGSQSAPATDLPAPVIALDSRRRRFSPTFLLTAAAAVVLLAVGAVVLNGLRDGSAYDDVVAAPDARVVELVGETGSIEVVWSPQRDQVALFGEGVAELGPGLRYALWVIADGLPIPAGLFEPDDGTIRDVADVADVEADAWGITVEPASGSELPTSDVIFFAEI